MEMDVAYGIAPDGNGGTVLDCDVHIPMKGFFFKRLAPLFELMAASKTRVPDRSREPHGPATT